MAAIIPIKATEKNMEALDNLIAEFNSMEVRRATICLKAFENFPHNLEKTCRIHGRELNINKNRIEYWLFQYDRFNELICTGGYLYKFPYFEPKLLRALIKTSAQANQAKGHWLEMKQKELLPCETVITVFDNIQYN